jgi:uncharacterized membrane protein
MNNAIEQEDTLKQRARILVKETKEFYFQIIFIIGLAILFIIRRLVIGNSFTSIGNVSNFIDANTVNNLSNASNLSALNSSAVNTIDPLVVEQATQQFFNQYLFVYMGAIFLIIILYKYLKLYNLKRKFKDKNREKGNAKLKKYMKSDRIPNINDIEAKFEEDKQKSKKSFYRSILKVAFLILILIALSSFSPIQSQFLWLIIALSIAVLIYRHIFVFHLDKKFLGDDWEDKKMREFIKELN